MLHYIIFIHRNPEILVFVSQIITIKIVRSQLKMSNISQDCFYRNKQNFDYSTRTKS